MRGLHLRDGSKIGGVDLILKGVHLGAEASMRDVVPGKMRLETLSFQARQLEVELIYKIFVP